MGGLGSGKKPREYPSEIVKLITDWYREGLTVAEIKLKAPKGYRIQTILERHIPNRRPSIKRNQLGENNSSWKGNEASYTALHLRVQAARGKPSECSLCDATSGRFEWANLTGDYANINDYARMCVICHRRFDLDRRNKTGKRTSPERRRNV
jgi:hypothetical protein